MMPVITAFARSPDRGRGLARDMAVRWAFEEVGQRYDVRLVKFDALRRPAHLALQPFGQIPTYQDDRIVLFESAAIVQHIADRHPGVLLPAAPADRARAIAWMFAAVSSVEPVVVERSMAMMLEHDRPWYAERLVMLDQRVRARLADFARHLGERGWLEGTFTAGDLMMVAVLRRLAGSGLLEGEPAIADYVARGERRPAFERAFAAQRAVFLAASAEQ